MVKKATGDKMFLDFLFLLRQRGLAISLGEWQSLLRGLELGLHHQTVGGFYLLARSVLVHREGDFDTFDACFLEYFKDVPMEQDLGDLLEPLLDWLHQPEQTGSYDPVQGEKNEGLSEARILEMLQERMAEQKERHDGGKYWIGTGGMSVFGNSGLSPKGIRVGGKGQHGKAFSVIGERSYRDFRGDQPLETRQFEMALRQLRQYSGKLDLPPSELDISGSIRATCDRGGLLQIRYQKPRRNTVKLLLCMDSGGSMEYYAKITGMLFQAVSKTSHFKDVQLYYFHNVPYGHLYTSPSLEYHHVIPTAEVLAKCDSEYKVIFVGDGQMAPYELTGGRYEMGEEEPVSGYQWLQRFQAQYPHIVWLNPSGRPGWGRNYSYDRIEELFPMYPLTVDGLEDSMKRLLLRQ